MWLAKLNVYMCGDAFAAIRSLDGAAQRRNPGRLSLHSPDSASLHPGYLAMARETNVYLRGDAFAAIRSPDEAAQRRNPGRPSLHSWIPLPFIRATLLAGTAGFENNRATIGTIPIVRGLGET
jgi:hypothetical protein